MRYFYTIFFAMIAPPALALTPVDVPEMEIGAGVAAVALVVGVVAIIREKSKRK
ncbi:MAG: hypothetical protein HKN14_00525 [Marinicaulis sp.]|nr:hypothetical protein [Marinicaulis sp.]NNL89416.1 hypothetical protein [Marinicaulis sp.]